MRSATLMWAALAASACSMIPPANPDGGVIPGSGGGQGGSQGSGGSGPMGLPDLIASPQYANVTGNLANLASDCGTLTMVTPKPDEDMLIAGIAAQGLWASLDGGP